MHLGEAGLVIQDAEDAVGAGGDEVHTGMEVLDRHGVPLDLLCPVLLLGDGRAAGNRVCTARTGTGAASGLPQTGRCGKVFQCDVVSDGAAISLTWLFNCFVFY